MVPRSHSQALLGTTPSKNHQVEPEQTPQGCAPHGCMALSSAPIFSARALRQVGCTDTLHGTEGHLKAIAS